MNGELKYLNHLVHCYVVGDPVQVLPTHLSMEKLLRLLEAHHVETTLAPVLSGAQIPDVLAQKLSQSARIAEQTNTVMLLELTRFLKVLDNAGCQPIVLKGAGLVQTIYKSLDQRVFADLDILVPLNKVEEARSLLESLGYVAGESVAARNYYTKYHFHLIMLSPGGITVEIHWNLTPPNSYYKFDIERLNAQAQSIDTVNGPIRVPGWSDQLLHCVFQNIADGFSGLRRIIDAALILPLIEDHDKLAAEAREQNLATGLWAVLFLVQELTGTVIPQKLNESIRPSGFVEKVFKLNDLPLACLQQKGKKQTLHNKLTDWLCLPTRDAAIHEIWHYLVPRSQDYFYYEHDFGAPPTKPRRLILSVRHFVAFFGLTTHIAWQLLTNRTPKDTP